MWNDQPGLQTYKVTSPGMYKVKVTNTEGCYTEVTVKIDTFPSPQFTLGADSFLCEGSSYELKPSQSYKSYTWSTGSQAGSLQISSGGSYWLKVWDQNNCSGMDQITIGSKPRPEINLGETIHICGPDLEIRAPDGMLSYQWQDGATGASYHVQDYGVYHVRIRDNNYCENSDSIEVRNACEATAYVPNAFTPNGDGHNDEFVPVVMNVMEMEFKVYNRWGEIVFETTEQQKGWDGKVKGKGADPGVLTWKLTVTGIDGGKKSLDGNVTLVR
jgi:gliding motility-associated-like protein